MGVKRKCNYMYALRCAEGLVHELQIISDNNTEYTDEGIRALVLKRMCDIFLDLIPKDPDNELERRALVLANNLKWALEKQYTLETVHRKETAKVLRSMRPDEIFMLACLGFNKEKD